MMEKLKKNIYDLKFGNWNHFNENIDPYRDYRGGDRIEEYIFVLVENLKKNKSFSDSIAIANKFFTNLYGNDKIYTNTEK